MLNKRMHDVESDFIDDASVVVVNDTSSNNIRFEDLNLSPELVKGLYEEMKFEMPTRIQSLTLPIILTPPYKNVFTQAYRVSGKTTCLVLAMLSRVDPNLAAPQALCLCPTLEDANQVMEVLVTMRKFTAITSELCSLESVRAPPTAQLIIGTPDNVDLCIKLNKLDTSNLKMLVLDDIHVMPGQGNCVRRIMKESPKCQVVMFSDTPSETFNYIAKDLSTFVKDLDVQELHRLFVDEEEPLSFDSVKQYNVNVLDDEASKITVIKDKIMALGDRVRQTVIFVRTIKSAEVLQHALSGDGYAVTTIFVTLTRKDRRKFNKEFKDGLHRVLITTSSLALGFDLSQVNLVINYDLPVKYRTQPDHEAYLRRILRAGRFGRKAAVFNLISGFTDSMIMEKIARHFNYYVTELFSRSNDDDFKDALEKAGLMGMGP